MFYFQIQNQLDEVWSEANKDRRLRERAEQYAEELKSKIELGRTGISAKMEFTQEISRFVK